MAKAISATAAVLIAGALGLGVAGCSGQEEQSPPAPFPSSGPMQQNMPQLPQLANQEGARRDLTGDKCEAKDGKWSAWGTVKNSTDKAMVYVVAFSVATQQGGMVRGRSIDTLTLKAGESKQISQDAFFTSDEGNMHCVTLVLRGTRVTADTAAATTSAAPATSSR